MPLESARDKNIRPAGGLWRFWPPGAVLLVLFMGFAPTARAALNQNEFSPLEAEISGETRTAPAAVLPMEQLPVRFQAPAYVIALPAAAGATTGAEDMAMKIGADISSSAGPVPLRDIMRQLAGLKKMTVSWANDVDQNAMVEVDIKADDNFFEAIDNILRQLDYFHEVQGNTVVVKYKDSRRFHIAMPFMASTFTTGVGGNVLGSNVNVDGTMKLVSDANKFDIWDNIQKNLDKLLEIWTIRATTVTSTSSKVEGADKKGGGKPEDVAKDEKIAVSKKDEVKSKEAVTASTGGIGKGYYTIDRPIGLITVNAPRPLLEKIAEYFKTLQKELLRQVSIEAKILEVELSNDDKTGINWSNLLGGTGGSLSMGLQFGTQDAVDTAKGILYPGAPEFISKITLNAKDFTVVVNALQTQGKTRVLANPRISVMNGQPALISVGANVTYIDKVTVTVSESGIPTTSVTTGSILSGLGLAVVATVVNDNEIILNLTPVTTNLTEPIEYKTIGENVIGLPRVKVKEISTTVKLKNGEMLVVGGLIDSAETDTDIKVPLLGDLPILGSLFKSKAKTLLRKELIILLRPVIL